MGLSSWETILTLAALAGLASLVGVGEGLRVLGVSAGRTRRLVHTGVSLFVAATPLLFTRPLPVYVLAAIFVVLNSIGRSHRWWRGIHEARPNSWGTVTLPLAVLPVLAATWSMSPGRVYILQVAFVVLGVADPLASALGERYGQRRAVGGSTWVGSGVCFGVTVLVALPLLLGLGEWFILRAAGAAIVVAVVTTAAEAVGRRGWDNLSVVLGVVLVLVPLHETDVTVVQLGLSLALGAGFAVGAHGSGFLDASGAVGGGLFAAALVGLGGWVWAVPGLVFFGLSSVLSRLPGRTAAETSVPEQEARRTLRQVLANGGVAWALLGAAAIAPRASGEFIVACYADFLGALAAAAADTWATEIGTRWGPRPWSLRTLSRVRAGTSGAVSALGSGAALGGAISVAGAAVAVGPPALSDVWVSSAGVVGAGVAGMLTDSMVGATIQVQYRDVRTGRVTERGTKNAEVSRGWAPIDNESVNLVGTTTGAIVAILLVI